METATKKLNPTTPGNAKTLILRLSLEDWARVHAGLSATPVPNISAYIRDILRKNLPEIKTAN